MVMIKNLITVAQYNEMQTAARADAAFDRLKKPRPTGPNGDEAAYGRVLAARVQAGEISGYRFIGNDNAEKLKLALRTYYFPDFKVAALDGTVEYHEVKGFMRDDAGVKLKVAAALYPLHRFYVVRLQAGGAFKTWDVRRDGIPGNTRRKRQVRR